MKVELIGVPFDGFGRTGHQALAPAALRRAGLEKAFGTNELITGADLDLPEPDPRRAGGSGIMNEATLLAMVDAVYERVRTTVNRAHFPIVYGGDCSVLLGAVPALRDVTSVAGLVFIDGHEDTTPLDVSTDGEAANMEVGLLLGITGQLAPEPLRRRLPALSPETLAILGPRDHHLRRQANVASLAERRAYFRSAEEVAADPRRSALGAIEHIRRRTHDFWLHIDLDVLRQDVLLAQRVPGDHDEDGGLQWPELTELVSAVFEAETCRGLSLVIYDPDQDPTGTEAERIVEFVRTTAAALP